MVKASLLLCGQTLALGARGHNIYALGTWDLKIQTHESRDRTMCTVKLVVILGKGIRKAKIALAVIF